QGSENEEASFAALPFGYLNPYADYPKQIGHLNVERTLETLTFRRENAGGVGMEAYALFGLAMLAITLIGFMGMMQGGQAAQATGTIAAGRALAPTTNHFALFWIIGVVALFVGIPLYLKKAYGTAHVFCFDKAAGQLTENKKPIVPLRRIEGVAIRETKDPDDRYLYLLEVLHTDGYELLVYNGYDERDTLRLAEEIAGFLDCRMKFTGVKA
ncbi:MAG: hypothetical protein H7Y38_09370, partial [Armatimonadetes bacterium]|nr:hypothetical protein [Armatimonadota bacterium]